LGGARPRQEGQICTFIFGWPPLLQIRELRSDHGALGLDALAKIAS